MNLNFLLQIWQVSDQKNNNTTGSVKIQNDRKAENKTTSNPKMSVNCFIKISFRLSPT